MSKYVCSLTTLPNREKNLYKTLISLLNQDILFDKIYITLIKKYKYNIGYLHKKLNKHKNYKLIKFIYIKYDYGPISKLIGGLFFHSDPLVRIITCDDDVIYPNNLLSKFIYYNKLIPNTALGSSGLSIGKFPNYISIIYNQKRNKNLLTPNIPLYGINIDILYGFSGILYYRYFFPKINYLYDNFLSLYIFNKHLYYNDDVSISSFLSLNNINRKIIKMPDVCHLQSKNSLSYNTYKFIYSLGYSIFLCFKYKYFNNRYYVSYKNSYFIFIILIIFLLLIFFIIKRYFYY